MIRPSGHWIVLFVIGFLVGCQSPKANNRLQKLENKTQYAEKFKWFSHPDYDLLEVEPLGESRSKERYLVVKANKPLPKGVAYDVLIRPTLQRIVATSTPQIAALEMLQMLDAWVGFPQPELLSSPLARQRVQENKVVPIGVNNRLNIEKILELQPELFLGFEIDGNNPSYTRLKQMGVPLVLVHDWMEKTPLGKAEWLLFFGILFGKKEAAIQSFKSIEKRYVSMLQKVPQAAQKTPIVLAGSVYKDQWYAPGGQSFFGRFLADARVNYVMAADTHSGSLPLSLEKLMLEGRQADVWMTPGSIDTYAELKREYPMLESMGPFQKRQIFTYKKYLVDGQQKILYFEHAGLHPDRVLEDLLKIFYPKHFSSATWHYFTPLK